MARGGLLLAATALGSCAMGPPSPRASAGTEAQRHGVSSYVVLRADPHDLDAVLIGKRPARLHVHVAKAAALQQLEIPGEGSFALATSETSIAAGGANSSQILAELSGDHWVARAPISSPQRRMLGLLMAVDVDFAVQGASMVFDGKVYARCTLECSTAASCTAQAIEGCAGHITICSACLEQEP